MKKQTSMKWFSGITAAVTAASFIGFVQTHSPEVKANANETEFHSLGDNVRNENSIQDDHEFNESQFGVNDEQSNQGFQASERRTRHS
ncbi:hypothetical protein [Bacillus sp. RAR_GA_16]|uniref:hypothetical protein n=1 Tax=Bacillus sp. RAR_GA_16 TaxID=2876774 RepID=UPI001CCD0DDE|nr:hypothetical protein [Bacillus sp. RAR_GA_16]MCA0173809.1 hypothetical protein [Bacillus sp. RAR_GA_16]